MYTSNYVFTSMTRTERRFVEARPFAAAGFKSYFNEWTYMRSDVLIAIGSHGPSHGTVRIGFGIDF